MSANAEIINSYLLYFYNGIDFRDASGLDLRLCQPNEMVNHVWIGRLLS